MVVGSAGGGAFFNLFAVFTIRKMTKAMMRKSIMVCTKTPQVMTVAPTVRDRSLKLTPPMISPITGMRMSLTSELTIFPNAPPTPAPTAGAV